MGIAGISLLMSIMFFVKSIKALKEYLQWRNKEIVVGTIGEVINSTAGKKYGQTTFAFFIRTASGIIKTEYKDIYKNDDGPSVKQGDEIEVFFVRYENQCQYREKAKLIRELWQNPLLVVTGIIIFILCALILAHLQK